MIDVDYFKPYNDALGHPAGDTCLVAVGRRIKRCVRRPADLVARYGGEEFAALLPDTEPEGAGALAEQIRAGVETLHVAHPSSPVSAFVTVSVGVATVRVAPGLARRALLHAADRALYRAKETGRNRIYATELPSEQAAMGE
jgi:diguanylate cyclase (GGDEF)-like protein